MRALLERSDKSYGLLIRVSAQALLKNLLEEVSKISGHRIAPRLQSFISSKELKNVRAIIDEAFGCQTQQVPNAA
jgi:hypothetical protein